MHTEFVRTTTADGLRLDGVWQEPREAAPAASIDAVLCLHGVASNFYGATLLEELVEPFVRAGIGVLRVNTRGHDVVTTLSTPAGPRRLGAAYEIVDECRYDVSAWLSFLAERGRRRVALFGHSLGAIKAVYAAAHGAPSLSCVLAASPPRLAYSLFRAGPQRADFEASIATAERHLAEGRPQALFDTRVPFPLLVGAAHYLDKYGPAERYDLLRFTPQVTCPLLFTYGTIELERGGVAFTGLPDALQRLPGASRSLEVRTIAQADHFYSGVRAELVRTLLTWLQDRKLQETPKSREG